MVRTLNTRDNNGYDSILYRELKNLAEKSGNALIMIVKNEPLTIKKNLERTVSELDAGLLNIRKEGLIRRFDSRKRVQVFSFYSSLLYFTEDILSCLQPR